jgi:pre-mRNA-splicing factor SYF1
MDMLTPQVYERGIELFHFPIAFEIWNIYLSKFVKRYGGKKLERTRDLFEQALENCPEKFCKPLYLMYAKLEEEHGLAKRAMGIYDRAATTVQPSDRFDMYTIYIAKAAENFGLPATRPIYERALESLPDKQTSEMCRRFAQMERKLGEIDRARAIYAHASQFCDPRIEPAFWAEWNTFESECGFFLVVVICEGKGFLSESHLLVPLYETLRLLLGHETPTRMTSAPNTSSP